METFCIKFICQRKDKLFA